MRYTHTKTRLLMSGIAAMVAAVAGCSQTPANPDTVVAGSAVTFQFDDVTHTVTWDQNPGGVANIPATSNADSTRVLPAGTYTFHCSIHTYMTGTIVAQ
jgi:plastocyanin